MEDKEACFSLRLPRSFVSRLDALRKKCDVIPSRNQMIIEIIQKAFDETKKEPVEANEKDLEEIPRSIIVWKSGKYWLIYDQFNDLMTQGKSYQDAVFMLSDALSLKEEEAKSISE
jgi:predicted RNase H-like HicB family nuclease